MFRVGVEQMDEKMAQLAGQQSGHDQRSQRNHHSNEEIEPFSSPLKRVFRRKSIFSSLNLLRSHELTPERRNPDQENDLSSRRAQNDFKSVQELEQHERKDSGWSFSKLRSKSSSPLKSRLSISTLRSKTSFSMKKSGERELCADENGMMKPRRMKSLQNILGTIGNTLSRRTGVPLKTRTLQSAEGQLDCKEDFFDAERYPDLPRLSLDGIRTKDLERCDPVSSDHRGLERAISQDGTRYQTASLETLFIPMTPIQLLSIGTARTSIQESYTENGSPRAHTPDSYLNELIGTAERYDTEQVFEITTEKQPGEFLLLDPFCKSKMSLTTSPPSCMIQPAEPGEFLQDAMRSNSLSQGADMAQDQHTQYKELDIWPQFLQRVKELDGRYKDLNCNHANMDSLQGHEFTRRESFEGRRVEIEKSVALTVTNMSKNWHSSVNNGISRTEEIAQDDLKKYGIDMLMIQSGRELKRKTRTTRHLQSGSPNPFLVFPNMSCFDHSGTILERTTKAREWDTPPNPEIWFSVPDPVSGWSSKPEYVWNHLQSDIQKKWSELLLKRTCKIRTPGAFHSATRMAKPSNSERNSPQAAVRPESGTYYSATNFPIRDYSFRNMPVDFPQTEYSSSALNEYYSVNDAIEGVYKTRTQSFNSHKLDQASSAFHPQSNAGSHPNTRHHTSHRQIERAFLKTISATKLSSTVAAGEPNLAAKFRSDDHALEELTHQGTLTRSHRTQKGISKIIQPLVQDEHDTMDDSYTLEGDAADGKQLLGSLYDGSTGSIPMAVADANSFDEVEQQYLCDTLFDPVETKHTMTWPDLGRQFKNEYAPENLALEGHNRIHTAVSNSIRLRKSTAQYFNDENHYSHNFSQDNDYDEGVAFEHIEDIIEYETKKEQQRRDRWLYYYPELSHVHGDKAIELVTDENTRLQTYDLKTSDSVVCDNVPNCSSAQLTVEDYFSRSGPSNQHNEWSNKWINGLNCDNKLSIRRSNRNQNLVSNSKSRRDGNQKQSSVESETSLRNSSAGSGTSAETSITVPSGFRFTAYQDQIEALESELLVEKTIVAQPIDHLTPDFSISDKYTRHGPLLSSRDLELGTVGKVAVSSGLTKHSSKEEWFPPAPLRFQGKLPPQKIRAACQLDLFAATSRSKVAKIVMGINNNENETFTNEKNNVPHEITWTRDKLVSSTTDRITPQIQVRRVSSLLSTSDAETEVDGCFGEPLQRHGRMERERQEIELWGNLVL